eukprot:scaffold156354_cov33-Tisochrysis_lutea.AAC.2
MELDGAGAGICYYYNVSGPSEPRRQLQLRIFPTSLHHRRAMYQLCTTPSRGRGSVAVADCRLPMRHGPSALGLN